MMQLGNPTKVILPPGTKGQSKPRTPPAPITQSGNPGIRILTWKLCAGHPTTPSRPPAPIWHVG